ncbi:hypothetical protein BJX65DRAFT_198733 [Aspergillus insuetus]
MAGSREKEGSCISWPLLPGSFCDWQRPPNSSQRRGSRVLHAMANVWKSVCLGTIFSHRCPLTTRSSDLDQIDRLCVCMLCFSASHLPLQSLQCRSNRPVISSRLLETCTHGHLVLSMRFRVKRNGLHRHFPIPTAVFHSPLLRFGLFFLH